MRQFLLFAFLLSTCRAAIGQSLPLERRSDWARAGRLSPLPDYAVQLNITDFGGAGDSLTLNETAFDAALDALAGRPGVVLFPPGKFLFHQPIFLRDSLILRGAGAGLTALYFDFGGIASDCIVAQGTAAPDGASAPLAQATAVGDSVFLVNGAANFQPGDFLKLRFNDSLTVTSDWARGSAGQLFDALAISGDNQLIVNHPCRFSLPLSLQPRLQKISPVNDAGIECLKIKRLDATAAQSANISFLYTRRCWLSGVESQSCNYAHFALDGSAQCEVYGCYFQDAYAYGGGGQGYGIACEFTSSDNRVQNCIFRHLRHSILLQSGATGNVFGYNFSTQPTWEEIPNDGAGELVLHGNFPSYNLFEGNVCQNIRPDGSHGANGPFNTFFRNRTAGYGIIFTGTQASYNVLGNEVVPGGLFQGLYLVNGANNLEYGNNVGNTITPAGTNGAMDTSLYINELPHFLSTSNFLIGLPKPLGAAAIPAQLRFVSGGEKTDCDARGGLFVAIQEALVPSEKSFAVYPNPATTAIHVALPSPVLVEIFDIAGRLCFRKMADQGDLEIGCSDWPTGIYFIRANGVQRVVKLEP